MANHKLRWTFAAAAFWAVILIAPPALAGAGDPDPSFGDGGKVIADMQAPSDNVIVDAAVLQPDGKIVVLGSGGTEAVTAFFTLVRYNSDGSLDPSFGDGGIALTGLAEVYVGPRALALQPDGKILVVGRAQTDAGNWHVLLARYHPDGSPDTGFGSAGVVITDFGNGLFEHAYAVAVQADGRIIAAGHIYDVDLAQTHFALARYWPDGRLDASFGQAGKVVTAFGETVQARDIAVQSDDKIVVAGRGWLPNWSGTETVVARYDPDGSLGSSFGSGGKVQTPDYYPGTSAYSNSGAYAVALQDDGRIVTAGYSYTGFGLIRYNPDGSLDESFGTDGKATVDFEPAWAVAYDVAVHAEGRIVASGVADTWLGPNEFLSDFALARFNADGSLDASFGDGGVATADVAYRHNEYAADMVLQPDGKIVLVGHTIDSVISYSIAMARLNPDGSLDSGFGAGGKVVTDLADRPDVWASAVALRADGGIVAGGGWADPSTGEGIRSLWAIPLTAA